MLDKVFIIIVIYNIKLDECLTYKSLVLSAKEFNCNVDLMVYDNSPVKEIYKNHSSHINITYLSDTSNPGLSKAYNTAATYALEHNKKWIVLLDQDSILPLDYFASLSNTLSKYGNETIIAPLLKQNGMILSPCKFIYMKGSNFKSLASGYSTFKNLSIFNSGMVINLDAYFELGGYSEEISLDFSDHYFIEKVKAKYERFVIAPIEIEHQLSSHTNLSKSKLLKRHIQFCKGGRSFSGIYGRYNLLFFWILLRSIKLTLMYRDIDFLIAYQVNFLNYKS